MIQGLYLSLIGFLASKKDNWHDQILLGELGVFYWVSLVVTDKTNKFVGIAFAYFATVAVLSSSSSALFMLCTTLPFIFCGGVGLKNWLKGFQLLSVVNAIYMVVSFFITGSATGLLGMDSIDGSLLALIFPSLIFSDKLKGEDRILAIGLVSLALILSRSSTVFGVLCLQMIAYLWITQKKKIIGTFIGPFILGCWVLGHQLFNPNGRDTIFKLTWNKLTEQKSYFLGLGSGSFEKIMPGLQDLTKPFFSQAHNEPLQILFEQGLLGLVLVCLVYFILLKKAKGPIFLMVLGAGFQSVFQPSFRYFIFALFLAFLTRLTFEDDTNFV